MDELVVLDDVVMAVELAAVVVISSTVVSLVVAVVHVIDVACSGVDIVVVGGGVVGMYVGSTWLFNCKVNIYMLIAKLTKFCTQV